MYRLLHLEINLEKHLVYPISVVCQVILVLRPHWRFSYQSRAESLLLNVEFSTKSHAHRLLVLLPPKNDETRLNLSAVRSKNNSLQKHTSFVSCVFLPRLLNYISVTVTSCRGPPKQTFWFGVSHMKPRWNSKPEFLLAVCSPPSPNKQWI